MSEDTKVSIPLSELSLAQLVQLSQGIGRQIDELREKRAYLKAKIDERIAAGEVEHEVREPGDGSAPGAVIETQTE